MRSYRYNARGERVAATQGASGPVAVYTLYDEAGHWIGDYDADGAAQQQAVWLGDAPVGVLTGAGSAQKLHYVQPDHLGTPRAVIDAHRDVAIWTWNARSEAFGNDAPNQDPDQDGTAFVFDMRFPGQRFDAATGLNYNYFRDYDAAIGRYIQSDPIGLNGGLSTFAYGYSRPSQVLDPNGLVGYICQKNYVNIGIALPIYFEGGSEETRNRIVKRIEKTWTGTFGMYNVKLVVVRRAERTLNVNTVRIHNGAGRASAGTNDADVYEVPTWPNGESYPHEAGHLLGLPDRSGKDSVGSIMGRDLLGAKPKNSDIEAILNSNIEDYGVNYICDCKK